MHLHRAYCGRRFGIPPPEHAQLTLQTLQTQQAQQTNKHTSTGYPRRSRIPSCACSLLLLQRIKPPLQCWVQGAIHWEEGGSGKPWPAMAKGRGGGVLVYETGQKWTGARRSLACSLATVSAHFCPHRWLESLLGNDGQGRGAATGKGCTTETPQSAMSPPFRKTGGFKGKEKREIGTNNGHLTDREVRSEAIESGDPSVRRDAYACRVGCRHAAHFLL